jgi:hypothetical protein
MKKVIFLLLIARLLAGPCFAEVLMTAPGQGPDNMAWQLFSSNTPLRVVNGNTTIFGPKFIIGMYNDVDLIGKAGSVSTNIDGTVTAASEIGLGIKSTIPKSIVDAPFDLAVVFNNDSISGKDFRQDMSYIGFLCSKSIRDYLDMYWALYSVQDTSTVFGARSETSFDTMWGFGYKYHWGETGYSTMTEVLNFVMSGDTYTTFCFAFQRDLL